MITCRFLVPATVTFPPSCTTCSSIFMFSKDTSEPLLSSQSSLAQTWQSYHQDWAIFSPLHHKQIGLLHLCLDPDCISLLIPHCLNILSSSLWHFQLARHLLFLHVCLPCLTAFASSCLSFTHTHTSKTTHISRVMFSHTNSWAPTVETHTHAQFHPF